MPSQAENAKSAAARYSKNAHRSVLYGTELLAEGRYADAATEFKNAQHSLGELVRLARELQAIAATEGEGSG